MGRLRRQDEGRRLRRQDDGRVRRQDVGRLPVEQRPWSPLPPHAGGSQAAQRRADGAPRASRDGEGTRRGSPRGPEGARHGSRREPRGAGCVSPAGPQGPGPGAPAEPPEPPVPPEPPPAPPACPAVPDAGDAEALRRMIFGFRTTQLVAVAARLGLADRLRDGPLPVPVLAAAAGVDADRLRRLLRALASLGVFAETAGGAYALTPRAQALRGDVEGSLRDVALLYGEPWLWQAYGQLGPGLGAGATAFEQVHGQGFYAYLQAHPQQAASFQRAMTGFTEQEVAAIAAACELSTARTVVDVGGGHGGLVAALLECHPRLHGIVFDLPEVIGGAQRALRERGLAERCECVGGDFFAQPLPAGGDVYLLKSVLHNWADDTALRILGACRRAMAGDARLVIAERLVSDGNGACEAKLFDIHMLVTAGGRERTREEYRRLLERAGLRMTRVVDTASALGLIEAVRAGGG